MLYCKQYRERSLVPWNRPTPPQQPSRKKAILSLLVLLALTCVVVFIFSSHWAEISTALAQLSFWQVLLVLAIGAGSVFFSHLNDAGFWLVKEYFGMSVGPDAEDLVADGNHSVGGRSGLRDAALAGALTH